MTLPSLPPRHPSLMRSSGWGHPRRQQSTITADEQARRSRAIQARDEALREIERLEKKLQEVQEECREAEQRIALQKENFEREMDYIAFGYLQDHPHENYINVIGPTDSTVVESSTQIGEYQLDQVLGKGTSGRVCRATHSRTNERFAIKVLNKDDLASLNILQGLVREIRALEVCREHPNVIGYHGVVHAPDNIYLIQDLAHTDLHNYLSGQQDLRLAHIQTVFQGVFLALDFAHGHGIAHMDVKPENILISDNVSLDDVKPHHIQLCDFGISKHSSTGHDGHIPISSLCGSPGYFAPELATVSAEEGSCEGRAADMWSVGATLLETVAGLPTGWSRTYRLAQNAPYIFQRGIFEQVHNLPKMNDDDSEVFDLIGKLLAVEPKERIPAKESLKHRWFL